jgi:hypothetical protein
LEAVEWHDDTFDIPLERCTRVLIPVPSKPFALVQGYDFSFREVSSDADEWIKSSVTNPLTVNFSTPLFKRVHCGLRQSAWLIILSGV